MATTRKVVLEVELPPGLAELAETLQDEAPELLSGFIRYGVMRHEIYKRLREQRGLLEKEVSEVVRRAMPR